MKETFAVVYTDTGPRGGCGQEMETTSSHTKVFLFDTEVQMDSWLREMDVTQVRSRNRSHPRIARCCPKGHPYHAVSETVEWPALPDPSPQDFCTALPWHKVSDEPPKQNRKILVFSAVYPEDYEMRFRIMDGRFLKSCPDATLWMYCDDLMPNFLLTPYA
jgi:hypothetical protein